MIGSKIKNLRTKNNLTQEQLATKLYVTRNAISKWETDKGIPSIESIKNLAKIFNVSLEYLLNEEDLISITIDNSNKLELTKNLIYSILLFFYFLLIGTLIPYFFMDSDPTDRAVFMILLPMSYVLLGVISVLFSAKWPYVIISSALALTPIYVFFDLVIKSVSLGFWGIVYYLLFIGSYFIVSKFVKSSTLKGDIFKLHKLFFFLSLAISLTYIIHTLIEAISLYNCVFCSAPWYTAVVINTLFYIIPFTFSCSLYFYYKRFVNIAIKSGGKKD